MTRICPKCEGRPDGYPIELDSAGNCRECGKPIDERSLREPPDLDKLMKEKN